MHDYGRDGEEWWVAEVVLNGTVVASGQAPGHGAYRTEGVGKRSAVSLAKAEFNKQCLSDIRDG